MGTCARQATFLRLLGQTRFSFYLVITAFCSISCWFHFGMARPSNATPEAIADVLQNNVTNVIKHKGIIRYIDLFSSLLRRHSKSTNLTINLGNWLLNRFTHILCQIANDESFNSVPAINKIQMQTFARIGVLLYHHQSATLRTASTYHHTSAVSRLKAVLQATLVISVVYHPR